METISKSYRISRRAGYQGLRPSVGNQAAVEKLATGKNSSEERPEGIRTEKSTLTPLVKHHVMSSKKLEINGSMRSTSKS